MWMETEAGTLMCEQPEDQHDRKFSEILQLGQSLHLYLTNVCMFESP